MASEIEWETGLLGMTCLYYEEVKQIAPQMRERDFMNSTCRQAWAAFKASSDSEDYLSRLGKDGLLESMNHWVSNSADGPVCIPSAVPWAVSKIKRASLYRRLINGIQAAWDNESDLLVETQKILEDDEQEQEDVKDVPVNLYQAAIEEMLNDDLAQRIYTGLSEVDNRLGGLRKGNVSVLGAEPSTGKTALALNIARHSLEKGRKVLFFSLEMSSTQLIHRMVVADGKLSYSDVENKRLGEAGKQIYANAAAKLLGSGNLYIFDTVYQVEKMAEYVMSVKPDLVIVDFLQFCRTATKHNNTADKIEYIVSEFKRVAKLPNNKCHILLLSQPSRQSGTEKQSMFTLKGSSAIEQGGDVVMMLDRPGVRNTSLPPERASLQISKNKFGRTGPPIDLVFEGEHQRFRDKRPEDAVLWQSEDERANKPW